MWTIHPQCGASSRHLSISWCQMNRQVEEREVLSAFSPEQDALDYEDSAVFGVPLPLELGLSSLLGPEASVCLCPKASVCEPSHARSHSTAHRWSSMELLGLSNCASHPITNLLFIICPGYLVVGLTHVRVIWKEGTST